MTSNVGNVSLWKRGTSRSSAVSMASNGGVADGSESDGPFKFGIGEGECGKLIWWMGSGWDAAVV